MAYGGAPNRRPPGFTLVELLVVIAVIALLIGILLPALGMARESARRLQCATNVRSIAQATMLYGQDNKGSLPRVHWDTSGAGAGGPIQVSAGRFAAAPDPFAVGLRNDVTAAYFLLLRQSYLVSDVFVDPSTDQVPDDFAGKEAAERSNFTRLSDNLSYAMLNPYPDLGSLSDGYSFTTAHLDQFLTDMPLAADSNPGCCGTGPGLLTNDRAGEPGKEGNSNNHNEDGQNVAYADASVRFQRSGDAGPRDDNIYIRRNEPVRTKLSPMTQDDAILLPTDDD